MKILCIDSAAALFGAWRASRKLFLKRSLPPKGEVFVAYNTILV
jgi:hypothetical protein